MKDTQPNPSLSVIDHPSHSKPYLDPTIYNFTAPVTQRLSLVCAQNLSAMTTEQFTELLASNVLASGFDANMLEGFGQIKQGWGYLAFLISIATMEKTMLNFVLAKHKEKGLDVQSIEPRLRKMKDILDFGELKSQLGRAMVRGLPLGHWLCPTTHQLLM